MKRNVKRHAVIQPLDSTIRLIPLTQNCNAIVDAADYEWLNRWSWCANRQKPGRILAVRRSSNAKDGFVYMSREILGISYGDRTIVDHINGNPLDNRRANLRCADYSTNGMNRGKQNNNTSGYKGVTWRPRLRKWLAQIQLHGRNHYIGIFSTAKEAHDAYAQKAKELHSSFARIV